MSHEPWPTEKYDLHRNTPYQTISINHILPILPEIGSIIRLKQNAKSITEAAHPGHWYYALDTLIGASGTAIAVMEFKNAPWVQLHIKDDVGITLITHWFPSSAVEVIG